MASHERADEDLAALESALWETDVQRYLLHLYITGTTPHSTRALANIRRICELHLAGRYELEVIDILEHPALAEGEQIIAAPTLIRKLPLPLRRFIGDMSDTDRLLVGLDLQRAQ
ncbi:MAG TPA: circadian clock KaiB family protein [Gemmatimonadaceae bacterium]|nr:circadian clock KaiB family protein [Gemmatimonadaceae bacterium]